MKLRTARPIVLLMATTGTTALGQDGFPVYDNQNSAQTRLRSGLATSDTINVGQGRVINNVMSDRDFAQLVAANVRSREAVFAFNQCFGGGFIDDLVGSNLAGAVSYTAAARHNQISYARSEDPASGVDPNFNTIRRTESTYSLHWAPLVGGANPVNMRQAAQTARAEDIVGPVRNLNNLPRALPQQYRRQTEPQYTSSGQAGDNIVLRQGQDNQRFRAILWGGSTQLDQGGALNNPIPAANVPDNQAYQFGNIAANWNTLERMYQSLIARGYADNEIYVMYPGGDARNQQGNPTGSIYQGGPAIPNWVDAGTRRQDLVDAFATWANAQTTNTTQFLFWSSFGHGVHTQNFRDANIPLPRGFAYQATIDPALAQSIQTIASYYADPANVTGNLYCSPYFEVRSTIAVPSLSVQLNGIALPLLAVTSDEDAINPGGFLYRFELPSDALSTLQQSLQQVIVDYDPLIAGGIYSQSADFILELGPTTGGVSNGINIPGPASLALAGVGTLIAARRRRGA